MGTVCPWFFQSVNCGTCLRRTCRGSLHKTDFSNREQMEIVKPYLADNQKITNCKYVMGPLTFITDCRANKWIGRKYIAIVDIPSNENLLERRSIYSLVRKERSRNNNVRHIVIKKSRNEIKATNRKEQFLLCWTHAWSCDSKMRTSEIHRNFNTQLRSTAGKFRTIKLQILRFGHSHS